jgi:hypothetical protein
VGEFSSPEQARAQVAYRYRYFWPQTEPELTHRRAGHRGFGIVENFDRYSQPVSLDLVPQRVAAAAADPRRCLAGMAWASSLPRNRPERRSRTATAIFGRKLNLKIISSPWPISASTFSSSGDISGEMVLSISGFLC